MAVGEASRSRRLLSEGRGSSNVQFPEGFASPPLSSPPRSSSQKITCDDKCTRDESRPRSEKRVDLATRAEMKRPREPFVHQYRRAQKCYSRLRSKLGRHIIPTQPIYNAGCKSKFNLCTVACLPNKRKATKEWVNERKSNGTWDPIEGD